MKQTLLFFVVLATIAPCQGQILKKLKERTESAIANEIHNLSQKEPNKKKKPVENDTESQNTNLADTHRSIITLEPVESTEDFETLLYESNSKKFKSFRLMAHRGLPRIGAVKHSRANTDTLLSSYKQYYRLLKLHHFDSFFEDIDREIPDISYPWTTEQEKNSALAQMVLKEAALENLTEEAKFVYFCDSDNQDCNVNATQKSPSGREVPVRYNSNIWGGGSKFREVRIYQKFVADGNIEKLRKWADKLFKSGQKEVYVVVNSFLSNYNIKEQHFRLELRLPHKFRPAFTPIDIRYQLKSGANFGYAEFQDVVFEHSDNILINFSMKSEDAEKLIQENTRGGYGMGRERINVFLAYKTRITFNKLEYPGRTPSSRPIIVMDIEMLSPDVNVYLDDLLTNKIGQISLVKH